MEKNEIKNAIKEAMNEVFDNRLGKIEKEISDIKEDIAPMKPIIKEYQERQAAISYGKKVWTVGEKVGGFFIWFWAWAIGIVIAIKTGIILTFTNILQELAKYSDKIPPHLPPGGGQ